MGLLDRFRRNPTSEKRDVTHLNAIPLNSDGYVVDAGVPVTERTALQSIAVNACVRLLADSVAGLPMEAYREQNGLCVSLDPQPSLVRKPWSRLTTFEWLYQTVSSLALRGNSYHLVVGRDSLEYPTDLEPIHPDLVQIEWNATDLSERWVYRINGQRVPNEDIVHIRRFALASHPYGLSPIEEARQGIGMALAAERFGARYFGQAAQPSAVLETDKDLTREQSRELLEGWKASHGGKRFPAVLAGGLNYRTISLTPEESQFLQTRQFQTSEIAMLFGVPPHMIGQTDKSTSWGTGIEQQSIGFVRYTLRPWLTCIEQALSDLLPRGQKVRFNADALLRGDLKSQSESWLTARNGGWLNVNEIRAYLDLPPVEGGDSYIQPLNMGPLGAEPPDAPTPPPADDQGEPNGPQV